MSDKRFNEIKELKQELLCLGYHQYQIDDLVREVVHTTQLEKLPSDELGYLVAALAQHRDFARRCHDN